MAKKPETEDPKADGKAEKNSQDDAFMREVDEAVRQQEMQDAAKKYGIPVGIALAIGLAALGGWTYYSNQQQEGQEVASEGLVQAMDQLQEGNLETASASFAPLAEDDGQPAHAFAAKMIQAGIAAQKGEAEEAAKIYSAIAADSSQPTELRNLATIREVGVSFDSMKPADVIAKMKPLAKPGTPWFPHAAEMLAAAYIAQEKPDQAGPLLVAIAKDEDAPSSLRSRARQLAGVLGFDAIEDPEELLEEVAPESVAQDAAAAAPAQAR